MKNRLKKITWSALPLISALFVLPLPAEAFAFLGPGLLLLLIWAALLALQYIGGQFFIWSSGLVSYVIDLNYHILESNDLIQTGWTIVRDVANLGFVIVIVVMAIATILRFKTYAAKELLRRLIAAAILVNFSLAIAGVFIDFSNVLTHYFFDPLASTGGTNKLVETISGAFDPQKMFTQPEEPEPVDPEDAAGGLETISTSVLSTITQLAFTVIFIFVAVFVLLAFALMLLLRYLYLSFLLIIAPIVWLFWVIPALSDQFSKWWSKFFKWIFFAPAASFFFYLTLTSFKSLSQGQGRPLDSTLSGVLGTTLATQGIRMILLTGLMIGGLIISEQMGIYGAQGAMGLMNKARTGTQKFIGERAKRGWDRSRAAFMASTPVQAVASGMKKVPGFKRAGLALGAQAGIVRQNLVDDAAKQISKYNDSDLAKNLDALSKPEKIAAMQRLAKNGSLGDLVPDVATHITGKNKELFESYGQGRDWTKNVEIGAGMNVKMADGLKAGDGQKVRDAAKEWIEGLTSAQISKFPAKDLFNGKDQAFGLNPETTNLLRSALIEGIAVNVPEDVAKLFTQVKGSGQKQLKELTDETASRMSDRGGEDKKMAERLIEAVGKVPSLQLFGSTTTTPAAGSAQPANPRPTT